MSDEQNESWFQQGYEGVKTEEERLASLRGPQRFWMPAGEKKLVVWVDDDPFCIYEYNPKMNGSWKNWFTDPSEVYPDDTTVQEALAGKFNRYYVGYTTIVDCSKWKDRRGNTYQYELKLFPAKIKSLKLLQSKSEDWEGMAGKVIKIRRTSTEDASCGNDFEKDREADMEKLWKLITYQGKKIHEWFARALEDEDARASLLKIFKFRKGDGGILVPEIPTFNYFETLKPKTPKELKAYLAGAKIDDPDDDSSSSSSSSSSGGSGGEADENVPF